MAQTNDLLQCNHVHVKYGQCIRDYEHTGPHKNERGVIWNEHTAAGPTKPN